VGIGEGHSIELRNPLTYIANIENLSPLLGGLPSWHSQLTTIVNRSNLSASGCEITGERFQPKRITDGENCGTFSTLASPVLSTSPAHISELANNSMMFGAYFCAVAFALPTATGWRSIGSVEPEIDY